MRRIWAFAAAAIGVEAAAAPNIEDVIAAYPPHDDVRCSYTTTATSDEYPGELRVERFTPPDRWELVSVNGAAPLPETLEDYADEAEDRGTRRMRPAEMDFGEIIDPATAAVASEDVDTVTFSFRPDQENMRPKDMAEKVRGTLTVRKADLRPLSFGMENTAPVSVAPSVKLQEFRQRMTFAPDPATGALLVQSMSMAMRGKMLLFKKMESKTEVGFSGYDCQRAAPDED